MTLTFISCYLNYMHIVHTELSSKNNTKFTITANS